MVCLISQQIFFFQETPPSTVKPGLDEVDNINHLTHPPDDNQNDTTEDNSDQNNELIKPSTNDRITAHPPPQSENCSKNLNF